MTRTMAALPVLLALVGCGSSLGPEEGRRRDLQHARGLWEAVEPSTYQYVVERLCFCPVEWRGPVRVHVTDGVATEWIYSETGEPVGEEAAVSFPTVDGLFDVIEDALDRYAHSVEVTYDEDVGVPLEIWIDYVETAVDEELGFRVVEQPSGG